MPIHNVVEDASRFAPVVESYSASPSRSLPMGIPVGESVLPTGNTLYPEVAMASVLPALYPEVATVASVVPAKVVPPESDAASPLAETEGHEAAREAQLLAALQAERVARARARRKVDVEN